MKKSVCKSILIVCLTVVMVMTGFPWPGPERARAELPSIVDEMLSDWLPQPGQNSTNSPFQSGAQGGSGATGIPDIPSLGLVDPMSGVEGGMPEDPVSLPDGSLILKEDDLVIDAPGFPVTLQRMYLSERKDIDGAFGFG